MDFWLNVAFLALKSEIQWTWFIIKLPYHDAAYKGWFILDHWFIKLKHAHTKRLFSDLNLNLSTQDRKAVIEQAKKETDGIIMIFECMLFLADKLF